MSTHLGTSLSPSSQHRNDSANLSARVSHGLKKSGDYVRDNSNQLRIPEFVIFGAMVFATPQPDCRGYRRTLRAYQACTVRTWQV